MTMKSIQAYLMILLNQGRSVLSQSLIFCLIVAIKEGEVLIQGLSSVEDLKVVFSNYKNIEFILRKRRHFIDLRFKLIEIIKCRSSIGKLGYQRERIQVIEF